MRWRVERAGAAESGGEYSPGWIASNGTTGAVFATWNDAMAFVGRRLKREERMSFPEVLERWGISPVPGARPPRPAWSRAPLTEDKIARIGELRAEGKSQSAIGRLLNVSQGTVSRYCRLRGW